MARNERKIHFHKDRLKYMMKLKRKRQSDLVKLLGKDITTIKKNFSNQTMLPEQLDQIARFLDMSFDDLTEENGMTLKRYREIINNPNIKIDTYPDGTIIRHYSRNDFSLFQTSESSIQARNKRIDDFMRWVKSIPYYHEDSFMTGIQSKYQEQFPIEAIIENYDAIEYDVIVLLQGYLKETQSLI
ncbi:MAG: helix-turn-helix transcriptional regulator [Solobacterium sp.]|nr:helix-turn-helix transcriptional regulator [Solobacterium sp.]